MKKKEKLFAKGQGHISRVQNIKRDSHHRTIIIVTINNIDPVLHALGYYSRDIFLMVHIFKKGGNEKKG